MVIQYQRLNRVFRALADPTRRRILEYVAGREHSVNELQRAFPISQPAVTKHLQVLERAGLITRRKEGRWRYSRARRSAIRAPMAWMRRYTRMWTQRLDALETLLADPELRRELDRDKR
jgi:DNA-binding transcriptional ArsR family regulator